MSFKNRQTALLWLIVIAYAGLFFPLRVSNIPLIALALFSLFVIRPQDIFQTLRENLFLKLILGLFVLQLFGLVYTTNIGKGLFVIEKKIWFLIVPVLLAPAIRKHALNRDLIFHWIGVISLLSSVVLLAIAAYRYYFLHYPQAFSYISGNDFEGFTSIHYVYYSMYFACGSIFLLDVHFNRWSRKKYGWWIMVLLLIYTTGIIFFVASKMAIAAFGAAIILLLVARLPNKRLFFFALLLGAIVSVIFLYFNEATRERFEGLDKDLSVLNAEVLPEEVEFTGVNLRLLFWKLNLRHGWQDKILLTGVGTGDAQDYMDSIYNLPQYKLYGYLGWDPHNEWVFALVQLGVLGVAALGLLYYFSFRRASAERDLKFLAFLIITLFFSLTESILELNKGIVYFALIYTLLTTSYNNGRK